MYRYNKNVWLRQLSLQSFRAIIRATWSGSPNNKPFVAQYVQVAIEGLTEDPMAPGPERMIDLLRALLAVRGLRTDSDEELDRYYIGNLFDQGKWNERTLESDLFPEMVTRLIEEIRASGNGKKGGRSGTEFLCSRARRGVSRSGGV